MARCASCGAETQDSGRFCASCGRPLEADPAVTADEGPERPSTWPSPRPSRQPSSGSRSTPTRSATSTGLSAEGRFLPGTQLSGRYRIVALLGKGGMGEVYRADDLTLGQPVALKFLPEALAGDSAALERFRNEVRSARALDHSRPNAVFERDRQPARQHRHGGCRPDPASGRRGDVGAPQLRLR